MCEKRMAIVCFTPQGKHLAEKIQDNLKIPFLDICWNVELIYRPIPFRQWMKEHFTSLDALIFIGAMGIVVRDMAPCLKSKLTDPAVVVLDEKGQFVISVLSGHLGGANALTKELAELLCAIPVVTTSSDVNGKIAIDVFAQKNNLVISSMRQAKLCASNIVSNEPVSFSCDSKVCGKIPSELSFDRKSAKFHVIVSPYLQNPADDILHLIPKAFVLGIGCKKGTPVEIIEGRVKEELDKKYIDIRSIKAMGTIDLKRNETGLIDFAAQKKIPLHFFSAEELSLLEGDFTPSKFVSQITGVENVCERAAFMLAKSEDAKNLQECMVLPKSGKDGVTVSIMKIDWSVRFE